MRAPRRGRAPRRSTFRSSSTRSWPSTEFLLGEGPEVLREDQPGAAVVRQERRPSPGSLRRLSPDHAAPPEYVRAGGVALVLGDPVEVRELVALVLDQREVLGE